MSRTVGAKDRKPREPDIEEGYCENLVQTALDVIKFDPPTSPKEKEMYDGFMRYLKNCVERDMKPCSQGAYLAMGITRHQAADWRNRPQCQNGQKSHMIKQIDTIMSFFREQMAVDGKVNVVYSIFQQKNYDGFRDQQDVVVSPHNPLTDSTSVEELQKRVESATYSYESLPDATETINFLPDRQKEYTE